MKIIALLGNSNTGKSHTLNIVYSFLLRDGYVQIPGHFRVLGNPKFEDVFDVLELNGKKVGIIGMGDYIITPSGLPVLIKEMQALGCDVVLCSCTNKPSLVAKINSYPNCIIVPKTLSSGDPNNRIVNAEDAEKMIRFI